MDDKQLLSATVDLCVRAGLTVRSVSANLGDQMESSSGVVRLRGEVIVMLMRSDPPSAQLEVLAQALREHATAYLETHFVAPQIRALLDRSEIG